MVEAWKEAEKAAERSSRNGAAESHNAWFADFTRDPQTEIEHRKKAALPIFQGSCKAWNAEDPLKQ